MSRPESGSEPGGYALLDSGSGRKLERFGAWTLARPCAQAVWSPRLPPSEWQAADGQFTREGGNRWEWRQQPPPPSWPVVIDGLSFKLAPTDFGHLGIFPEQRPAWSRLRESVAHYAARHGRPARVINLFAYSGGSTLACAAAGAEVCHVDASKGMVEWARENAALNRLQDRPVRWIVDDVFKFLDRELKRNRRYDGIVLDPPSFGRGARGEVFKIEGDLPGLLERCRTLISPEPAFVLLSCHTPEITPLGLHHLLRQAMPAARAIDYGEMTLGESGGQAWPVPSGSFGWWWAA